ncbi:MAG: CCA tRNA nucleotidyltransferase [Paracoccaceae bacterium]
MDRSPDKLTAANAPWLRDPAAQRICDVLADGGYQILFVGGCVRNAILGVEISDVDLSTDARPEKVIALAQAEGIKGIPTGIAHGTVTLATGGTSFEVTTFRKDIETDGRRAVVSFSDDIRDDAQRRDFTMNALYARPDGTIVDPLGGLEDALARRVIFIGKPKDRIREDYLRILRFFRFHAWYADMQQGMDPDALAAIAKLAGGLRRLSAERVGAEIRKLLSAPDPGPAICAMEQIGILAQILSGASTKILLPLIELEAQSGLGPDPIRRLTALGGEDPIDRLRLSKADAKARKHLIEGLGGSDTSKALGYSFGAETAKGIILLKAAMSSMPLHVDAFAGVESGARSTFPVVAADFDGTLSGGDLGEKLRSLKAQWLASDLTLSRDDLLG